MSSNRSNAARCGTRDSSGNNPGKKVRSISRRLAVSRVRHKIGASFAKDVLVLIAIFATWLIVLEVSATGKMDFKNNEYELVYDEEKESGKGIPVWDKLGAVRYVVKESDTGETIVSAYPFTYAGIILSVAAGIFIMQIICHWISYPVENSRVKRILRPLDSLADKADELARYDFSEDKYHLIENKIDNIAPDDENLISLGDEDLAGIERAMNSLLIRIRENNKQQARFVNDASHELRTPIAVIQGYANMLARWGRSDEKVLDESITAIQNESENMKHLVEQLLFLARGDAGRMQLNRTMIDLKALMREVYEESLMIDENHIYKLMACDDDVYINADESLIKQAVRVLVDNAAKYTHEKDEIILGVTYAGDSTAVIRVQDSGIGMKENDVAHMFERFYRADEARNFNGTGLGLSIAKLIVDKHAGHFEIVSREELGTRIDIMLPRAAAVAAPAEKVNENIA
ncbi:MAG: HAMP domain-containing histidine kinase [Lachnospiraceae bacterium]|nr:HAMP domain-containing histidine kinase [Lachnospiraceae bacterium]